MNKTQWTMLKINKFVHSSGVHAEKRYVSSADQWTGNAVNRFTLYDQQKWLLLESIYAFKHDTFAHCTPVLLIMSSRVEGCGISMSTTNGAAAGNTNMWKPTLHKS